MGVDLGIENSCWSIFSGLLTTLISCFFCKRFKGSVKALMYGSDAKELYGLRGCTNLKNIPTNSSGEGIMTEWVLFVWILLINLEG